MKIDGVAPTPNVVLMGGQTLRVWRGVAADGREVRLLVARAIVTENGRPRRFTDYDEAVVRLEPIVKLTVVP